MIVRVLVVLALLAAPLASSVAVENSDEVCQLRASLPAWAGQPCPSRAPPHHWTTTYESPTRESHTHIAVRPDGAVLAATVRDGATDALAVRALDGTTGAVLWHAETPVALFGAVAAILHDASGGRTIAAAGGTVAAFADDGTLLWTTGIGARAYDARLLDGDVVVLAQTSFPYALVLARLDGATGAVAWSASPASTLSELPRGLAESDGALLTVSHPIGIGGGFVVRAYDAANGAVNWARTFTSLASANHAAAAGDALYVVGYVITSPGSASPHSDAAVVALDAASGDFRWRTLHDVAQDGDGLNWVVADAAAGRVYAVGAGTTSPPATWTNRHDILALALDTTDGSLAWSALHSRAPYGTEAAVVAALRDGTLYVGGTTCPPERNGCGGGTDASVVAYDTATGLERWSASHVSPGTDSGDDVALSPDGTRVYLGGTVNFREWDGSNQPDSLVVAYGAAGPDTRSPLVAVEEGDADAEVAAVTLHGTARGGHASASALGDAETEGNLAVAGGDTRSGWLAASVIGDAEGNEAVSGTGNADGRSSATIFGDASGASPFTVAGTCNGRACYAASVEDDAHGERVGVSRDGDASGQVLAVSVHGDADGDWGSATLGGANGRCGAYYLPPCWHVNGAGRGGPDGGCHAYAPLVFGERLCVALP